MAKRISDLTATSALQSADYFEVSRGATSIKRDMFDEFGDNFAMSSGLIFNVSVKASVASSALTIYMTQADGTTNPGANGARSRIGFRSATLTSGAYTVLDVVTTLTTIISVGSTAGFGSAQSDYLHVYAINNAGVVELAWSAIGGRDENLLYSTTAEGGAGAADSHMVLYSTTARTNVPIRLIGKITLSALTPGSWTTAPTVISPVGRYIAPEWENYPSGAYVFPSGTINALSGVLTFGAATTAPTLPTACTKIAKYKVQGKMCDLLISLQFDNNAGSANGSGQYLLAMPLGLQIDTSIYPVQTTTWNASCLGVINFSMASGGVAYVGTARITVLTSTTMMLFLSFITTAGIVSAERWSSAYANLTSLTSMSLSGTLIGIPIV